MFELAPRLQRALTLAAGLPDEGESDGEIHRNRSQAFVQALALEFQDHYQGHHPPIRVFWSGSSENLAWFSRKEFLYDIAVCEVSEVRSAKSRAMLPFVTKAHWLVESEFERDSRATLIDMSKLAIASSKNKLFIGPAVEPRTSYLTMLGEVAKHCQDHMHLAIIDHPGRWKMRAPSLEVHKWAGSGWTLEVRYAT